MYTIRLWLGSAILAFGTGFWVWFFRGNALWKGGRPSIIQLTKKIAERGAEITVRRCGAFGTGSH
jgi:hypothetical protein